MSLKPPRKRKSLRGMGVCGPVAAGFACGRPLTSAKAAEQKLKVYKAKNIVRKCSNGGVSKAEMAKILEFEGVSWKEATKKYKKFRTIQVLLRASSFYKGTDKRMFIIGSATHYLTVIAKKTKKHLRIYDQRGRVEIENLKKYRIREILHVTSWPPMP